MEILYIYHHLGLGDSFICNGIIRYFSEQIKNIKIFSKQHNFDTVKFMYRDNPNIEVIVINNDNDVNNYLGNLNEICYILKVGFENLWANATNPQGLHFSTNPSFDVRFYEIIGLNFDLRFDKFKVQRDLDREKEFFKTFNVSKKDYIFVHDDDRYKIDVSKIETKLQIIKPKLNLTSNIFDYCYLIENAKEVHTIESSFQFMIDSLNLNNENYVHRYPRFLTEGEKPIYKTVKKIIY